MPKLIVSRGGKDVVVQLKDGPNVIGRSSQADVPLNDGAASREHAEIVVQGPEAVLVDRGSRNGTLLNGRKVDQCKLQPGDVIRIGEHSLHFDVKKQQGETRRQAPAESPVDTRAATARTVRGVLVKDYAIWSAGGMQQLQNVFRILGTLVLVVLGLGVLGVIALVVTSQMREQKVVSHNLIRNNPGFEGGEPTDWELSGGSSRIALDRSGAFAGTGCMSIDKVDPEQVLHCWNKTLFKLEPGKQVDVRGAVKSDAFKGFASVHVAWYDRANAVIYEDYSSPMTDLASWKKLEGRFLPPKSATGFKVSFSFIGGNGRLFVDEVEILNRTPCETPSPQKIGEYSFLPSPQAAQSCVYWKALTVMVNSRIILTSRKEGSIPVVFMQTPKWEIRGDKGSSTGGKVFAPMGTIDMTRELNYNKGTLSVDETFIIPNAQSFDQVEIVSDFPSAEKIDIPAGATTQRVIVKIGSLEFALEFSEPARVEKVDAKRLRQVFHVDREKFVVGWRIHEVSTTLGFTIQKLRTDVENLSRHKKWGATRDAYRALNEALKLARETDEIARNQAEIEKINQTESTEWEQVQRQSIIAILSQRQELAQAALKSINEFLERFDNPTNGDQLVELTRKLTLITTVKREETELPRRLLALGKICKDNGKPTLARGILQVVASRWESTDVAKEAQTILDGLQD